MRATLASIAQAEASLLYERQKEVASTQVATLVTLAIGCLAATGCAIGLGYWLTRAIKVPMQRAVDAAQAIATGDLATSVRVDSTDETVLLLRSPAHM
jgi:methyl-accepting chemotaxis protein